jgi:hypothetical protein
MRGFRRVPTTNTNGKQLRCDCGFVARGDDDAALVAAARAHALDVHAMDLPAPLVLDAANATAGPDERP